VIRKQSDVPVNGKENISAGDHSITRLEPTRRIFAPREYSWDGMTRQRPVGLNPALIEF
jgi:hypothetical protein